MTRLVRNATRWLALAVLLGVPAAADSQTQIDHTTFTAAVTATATSITLAAASGSSADDYLYVDGELMRLTTAVNASTTEWNVRRGLAQGFTPARRHPTTSIVWVLDSATEQGPRTFNVEGACTATTEAYLPHINTKEDRIFDCGSSGYWLERERSIVNVQSALTVCGGRYRCREEFNQGLTVMQDDGTGKSLADTEVNLVFGSNLGPITYREEQAKTASSWITINGQLDISGDNTTDNEGVEIVIGNGTDPTLNQTIDAGTNGACLSAMVTIADISGTDEVVLGWRQNEAFQDAAAYTGYTVWSTVGVNNTDGSIFSEHEVSGATLSDDSGINWADGERRALKVCISSGGIPSAYFTAASPDNEQPLYTPITMTNTGTAETAGIGMVPFISFLTAGTDGPDVTIQWIELEYAP